MECPRCRATMPQVAHFCHACGQDMRSADLARRRSFAVKPDEPVASFNIVSSIMPRGAGYRPRTYRLALIGVLAVALVVAVFGALPIAVMVAAFGIPIVYIVYVYDVNLWEDSPIQVSALAFGLTGVFAAVFTWAWTTIRPGIGPSLGGLYPPSLNVVDLLLLVLVVPIVGELLRQIGPLFLASRPRFDDLMDGLTFGIISGVSYAAFDTIVKHWSLITGGYQGIDDAATWAALIFLEGFIKPLIMGTATGIACAEFAGLGKGYDGFSSRWVRGAVEAILANVIYQLGGYLMTLFVPSTSLAIVLSVFWGAMVLSVLILRVRNVLHTGLLEAALEQAARAVETDDNLEFCPLCEMPVLEGAAFCNACGVSLRVASKSHQGVPAAVATAMIEGDPSPPASAQFHDEEGQS